MKKSVVRAMCWVVGRSGSFSHLWAATKLTVAIICARLKFSSETSKEVELYSFQGPRIFVGNGQIIETGAVLVKDGIIEEVFDTRVPDPNSYKAIVIEGSGKTLLPGLIDVHVHLAAPAGFSEFSQDFDCRKHVQGIGRLSLLWSDHRKECYRPAG